MAGQSDLTRKLVAEGLEPKRAVRPNTIKATILAALPATNRTLAELLGTHGGDVSRTMAGLIADGLVATTAKGRGSIATYSLTAEGLRAASASVFQASLSGAIRLHAAGRLLAAADALEVLAGQLRAQTRERAA